MTRRALGTRICSHFQVPAPIAARIQRTQVPFPVATASLTRDVVVRRWALDEQLTEDADGAGRQLKFVRDHWLAVALLPHLSGTGDRSPSWLIRRHQRKPEKYGVGGCPQVFRILTTDPIANRTADGKSSSRRTFPILGPRAGGYLRAIAGIDDAGANRPDAHLRLRKPPPGRGRGAADGAMTSAGASSSATSGESRSPMMSAASKRSISAKPARSRRK